MLTTRDLKRLGAVAASLALLACENESTGPLTPPVSPAPPVPPARVFTSLKIEGAQFPLAPIGGLSKRRFEVRAKDQYGVTMIVQKGSISVSSDDPGVATVTETQFWTSSFNGVPGDSWISSYLTAVSPGEAVIRVSWTTGGVTRTATSTVKVESTAGWSLKADPAAVTVKLGSTSLVNAMLLDATGTTRLHYAAFTADRDDVVDLFFDETCFYWYPCPGINVRGLAVGEATITVRLEGFSDTVRVTVVP